MLARAFKVPRSAVEITAGHGSKLKHVSVMGVSPDALITIVVGGDKGKIAEQLGSLQQLRKVTELYLKVCFLRRPESRSVLG